MESSAFAKYELGGAYHWKWYLVDYDGYRGFVDRIVARFPAVGRILDVGCGDGLISFKLFRRGLETVGIDDNELAIRLAEHVSAEAAAGRHDALWQDTRPEPALAARLKRGELSFRCQSAYDLAEQDSFDYALCCEVIEHVEHPRRLVEKLHAAIRSYAVITTPDGRSETPGPYDHQLWTPETLRELFGKLRSELIDVRPGTIGAVLYKR